MNVLRAGSYPKPLRMAKGKPVQAEAYDAIMTDDCMVYCITFGRDGSTSCYMIKRISLS